MDSGLKFMIQEDDLNKISKMYHLIKRVPGGLDVMKSVVADCVKELCSEIFAKKDSIEFVPGLLDLKKKFSIILEQAFQKDKLFTTVINKVCTTKKYVNFYI